MHTTPRHDRGNAEGEETAETARDTNLSASHPQNPHAEELHLTQPTSQHLYLYTSPLHSTTLNHNSHPSTPSSTSPPTSHNQTPASQASY